MLLAATLEFTLPLYDRCSHSLFLFITQTQTHNNTESASDVKSQAESFGF